MSQSAVDAWRMPFVMALPLMHRNLVRMFSVYRRYTLLEWDTDERTYDAYESEEQRDFFDKRLLAPYNDVLRGHRECEAAALQRFVVAASDGRRTVVALILNWRPPLGRPLDGTDGLKAQGILESLMVAQRCAQALGDDPLHVIGIVWNATKSPAQATRTRVLNKLKTLDERATAEFFSARELLFDPIENDLQPRRFRLFVPESAKDATAICSEYERLRRIAVNDPVWKRFGARPGAILEIERTDSRLGTARVLRVGAFNEATEEDRAAEKARIRSAVVC